jgi:hypothetical protein
MPDYFDPRKLLTNKHGVTSQKTLNFSNTAVRESQFAASEQICNVYIGDMKACSRNVGLNIAAIRLIKLRQHTGVIKNH